MSRQITSYTPAGRTAPELLLLAFWWHSAAQKLHGGLNVKTVSAYKRIGDVELPTSTISITRNCALNEVTRTCCYSVQVTVVKMCYTSK